MRFLAQRVQPVPAPKQEHVARLFADLDSDDFTVRDAAYRELLQLGDVVLPALQEAFARPRSLELRRRLEQLIALLEAPRGDALRSLRAVEALVKVMASGVAFGIVGDSAKSSRMAAMEPAGTWLR